MRLSISLPTLLLSLGLCVSAAPTAGGQLSLAAIGPGFTFEYTTSKPKSKNWIGIYHATGGGPDEEEQVQPSLKWEYAPGEKGSVRIDAPAGAGGKYKAYFLADDGYKWLAEPIEFNTGNSNTNQLKIMTYNLWYGGTKVNNYHEKQVKFIRDQNVDIVGFQEASGNHVKRLGEALGWNYHQSSADNTVGIISRHPIVTKHKDIGDRTSGVQINIDGNSDKSLNFWSAHLNAYPYGPYEFCFEKKSVEDVLKIEDKAGRIGQITKIVEQTKSQRDSSTPFILVGDFNAPSHLDWTLQNKHCDVNFEWPSSKIPTDAGLIDSYRVAHPDPATESGNTWSPIYPHNEEQNASEPQDRIDFIYHTKKLKVIGSETKVAGSPKAMPDHEDNEWTSDHASVVTTYELL
ncbi:Endonuclease/exonuclease/phosphatase [Massariosphaeria phaeospora]|uniref:Endonuclease/exonuclease/phosphatase n=1 Tax=Massariosphaeria phaeospora TaxID=100035 RepID=A0A7C8I6P3_9PLEO|nr:Endonuclease/exonuclease/phosphatase [Massariosphaeria phaeospora]